jgi:hypothetical protein
MWILRKGRFIRVQLEIDPCWNQSDIWAARNLVCRFVTEDRAQPASLSIAAIWKRKWGGTTYPGRVETLLRDVV